MCRLFSLSSHCRNCFIIYMGEMRAIRGNTTVCGLHKVKLETPNTYSSNENTKAFAVCNKYCEGDESVATFAAPGQMSAEEKRYHHRNLARLQNKENKKLTSARARVAGCPNLYRRNFINIGHNLAVTCNEHPGGTVCVRVSICVRVCDGDEISHALRCASRSTCDALPNTPHKSPPHNPTD